jgi:hypothetical protein
LAIASIFSTAAPHFPMVALALLTLSLLIGFMNFYLSFLRPHLWERKHGSMNDYRFVSGFPAFATVGACGAIFAGYGSSMIAGLAILILLIDAGGLPWFVATTWHDESLWGAELKIEGEQTTDGNHH